MTSRRSLPRLAGGLEKTVNAVAHVIHTVVAGDDLVLQTADARNVESNGLADPRPFVQVY